jgi:hypothetical protein
VYAAQNSIAGAIIDARDDSVVDSIQNRFTDGSIFVWGKAVVSSTGDSYEGTMNAALIVSAGKLKADRATIQNASACGAVAFDAATLEISNSTIAGVGKSGVMVYGGASVALSQTTISESGEFGVITHEAATCQFSELTLSRNHKSGAEISRSEATFTRVHFTENDNCGAAIIASKVTIVESEFLGNKWSGLHLAARDGTKSEVTLANPTVQQNERGGVFVATQCSLTVSAGVFQANQWAGVYVERGSSFQLADAPQFAENQIGLVLDGEGTVASGTFTKHTDAALSVSGRVTVSKGKFTSENQAIVVAQGGDLTVDESEFEANTLNLVVREGGAVTVSGGTFVKATGDAGIHVCAGKATFSGVTFEDDKKVSVYSEGELNVTDSRFTGSGEFAVVFNGQATGEITGSKFVTTGLCALQCHQGTPKILQNEIKGHKKFGISIVGDAAPVIEANDFEQNGLANIWRQ